MASETILFKVSDPRVRHVTVTRVEVSADLQHAKVYVSIMGTPARQKKALAGLQNAAGFIQSQLGDRMKIRYTPSLRFFLDQGIKQSVEISRLINEALGRNPTEADADQTGDDGEDEEDEVSGEEEFPPEASGEASPPRGH